MTWYPIAFLPSQYSDNAGQPYSGAVLKAYAEGTTNNIQFATNTDGDGLASSFELNALGFPVSATNAVVIPHIQEDYKLALYPDQASADADSGALWIVDEIKIADPVGSAFLQTFSGDGSTEDFTLSDDLGTDEKTLMIFADKVIEYTTNGTFDTDTDWTKGTGWTIAGGLAVATGGISTDLEQNAQETLTEGESYSVTFTVSNRSAGGVIPKIGGEQGTERTANGTYTETIIAGSTQVIAFEGNGFTGEIDVVSVNRVNSSRREILSDTEFTVNGTALNIPGPVPEGTNNILVFAPSLLLSAAGGSAASAAISEANAAGHAATALAQANIATAQAVIATNAVKSIISYDFSNSVVMDDPGTGIIRLNNATLASVTAVAIDDLSGQQDNPDLSDWIATWDDGTSAVKGTLNIQKEDDPNTFIVLHITGLTDNAGWTELAVVHVASNGTFADADDLIITFMAKGDAGNLQNVVEDTTPQLGGNLDMNGNTLEYATNAIGAIGGGTQDIDLDSGRVVSATVDTSATTFTFSNPLATGFEDGFVLYLTNGGSQTVTWPAAVDWAGGNAPDLTAAGIDVLVFVTIDGGTTWYGFVSGLDLQ
jgi:hypothetical protein